MAEVHNRAMVSSQSGTSHTSWHPDAYTMWAIVLGVIFIAAIAAIVITAMNGMGTAALIIALFTAAFFSRCAC
jgi:prepilin signal peptidase PulO-like enzyme (type II secretory pathway)